MTGKELETFEPYAPPYWEERAWIPDGHPRWEQKALVALEHSATDMLEELLATRERVERWRKPYGKTRAFALDYRLDIIAGVRWEVPAETPQMLFEEWRAEREQYAELWPMYGGTVQVEAVQP